MDRKIRKLLCLTLLITFLIPSRAQASDHEALIIYREPDAGTNQYYEPLEVRIRLEKGDGILKYLFSNKEGTITGEVTGCGNEIVLSENKFREGSNELEFWIEKEGVRVDNTTNKKSFYLSLREETLPQIERVEDIKEEETKAEETKAVEIEKAVAEKPIIHKIIDETKPKIRTPSNYRTSPLRSFIIHENEKLVEDETHTLVVLKIDGKVYQRGKKIKDKGSHILEIWARDLAGNETRKSYLIKIGK